MSQVAILVGTRVYVSSFVDGTRVVRHKFRETEADVFARALWLQNHGRLAQAEEYLDRYVQRNSVTTRH